ncbi:MAG: ABC transporter substrate-binding protein [Armatimonadetes bacterium]|nr:ABC transporter substrate-binding protein [Armatimonadota bacterium]
MRFMRTLLVLTLVIMLAGVTGVAQGQAVRNPDTLVIATIGDPETLDYSYAYDTASSQVFLWHIYETLIFFNGGSTGTFVPMLATEVPSLANGGISKDGRTYTFKLRDGVKFHDGTPLTAEDVKYSLLRFMFMDRDGGPSELLLTPIVESHGTRDDKGTLRLELFREADNAIKVSGNTISITLKRPFAPFLSIMATWSMAVSKKWAIAQRDWNGTAGDLSRLNNPKKPDDTPLFTKTNGTGPFKLVQWDRSGRQVIMERNDTYWRKPAALKRVIIRVVEDFGARRLMLQQGDADIVSVGRPQKPQVEGLPGVRIIDDLSRLVTHGVFMNMKVDTGAGNPDVGSGRLDGAGIPGDFFADVNVRRGIAQAFDYNTALRDCWGNKATVGNGPIPKGMFGYISTGKWYAYDPAKAAAAFREARGGQVWSTGFRFSILYNTGNTIRECMAGVLKAGVEALNPKFRVDVRSITFPTLLQQYRQGRLPIFIIGWAADFPDADNFVTPFMHSTGVYSNAQGYKSPEVDKLIEEARFETDPGKRRATFAKLQEFAYNDVTTIYYYAVGLQVMRSWVRGWYHNPAFFAEYLYPMFKQ